MDFAAIQEVLNRVMREPLQDYINRTNPVLRAITKRGVSGPRIYIKGISASDHEAGPVADDSVVTVGTPGTTLIQPTLDWSTYKASFRIAKRATAQAAGNPGVIGDLFRFELEEATKDLADRLATDLFAGSTTNGLVGIQAILDNSNTYAGIDRSLAANSEFRGLMVDHSNLGVPQELSTQVLYSADQAFFDANGYGFQERPGEFTGVSGSALLTKYKALLESIDLSALSTAHFVNQANQAGTLGIGSTGFMGVPFIRDRNVSAAAGDDVGSGRLYFLNMAQIFLATLAPDPTGRLAQAHQQLGAGASPTVDGLTPYIEILGNRGEFIEGYVKVYVQLVAENPKAAGVGIKNIAIT